MTRKQRFATVFTVVVSILGISLAIIYFTSPRDRYRVSLTHTYGYIGDTAVPALYPLTQLAVSTNYVAAATATDIKVWKYDGSLFLTVPYKAAAESRFGNRRFKPRVSVSTIALSDRFLACGGFLFPGILLVSIDDADRDGKSGKFIGASLADMEGTREELLEPLAYHRLAFLDDSGKNLLAYSHPFLYIFDTETGRFVRREGISFDLASALCYRPNSYVLLGPNDCRIQAYDLKKFRIIGKSEKSQDYLGPVEAIAWSPLRQEVAVGEVLAEGGTKPVYVDIMKFPEMTFSARLYVAPKGRLLHSMDYNEDGTMLACVTSDGVAVFEMKDRKARVASCFFSPPQGFSWPRGRASVLWVRGSNDEFVSLDPWGLVQRWRLVPVMSQD